MGELVLIRHGETEWTLSGQHTSYTDLPLTDNGEEQARGLAPLVASRHISCVMSSPMQRAQQTAKLAGLDRVRIDPDLREWDYGGYEGVTTHDIHRDRPDWDIWTDGVVPGPKAIPVRRPRRSAPAPTGCSPGSRRPSPTATAAMSSWSRTPTSCGSSPPAGSACPRPTARSSSSPPARSAGSATSTGVMSSPSWNRLP